MNMWFQKLMRQFFFNIDKIVFGFISSVYDLLISIARTTVLSQADIMSMADRIYKLLAIFMVFKVTFSLIMYVVNPDDFSDKAKGVSKLGTNIIISLAILVLTPYIFNYAYQFQTIILEDNSLAALIFGDKDEDNNYLNTAGDNMAYIAMTPFFTPNVSIDSLMECTDVNSDACSSGMKKLTEKNDNFTTTQLNNYKAGIANENLGLMFRQDLAIATTSDNEDFIMDYKYLFSTVIGVIIVLLLITFCLDIAVRSIKLAFLQLVAPIPIISYVDPKSGKDGMFKKWYQMCFKTYLSLFIRIIALYFAIYIISRLDKMSDIIDGSYITNGFIKIFIIIGALMFAKQLPKILEGLGIKLDGGLQLNPLKKIEKEALGGESKLAKGILHAPMGAVKTLGKKSIGAVDAAINGKGLRQGWNRTHGSLYNNFYKKLDEWAPDSAEARKNARTGRENIHKMDQKAIRGEQVYKDAQGDDKNLKFSAPYRASYNAMNKAKGEMYAAEAKKTAQIAAVENDLRKGIITEAEAQDRIGKINKEAGTANKRYEVAKARHDEMKKVYTHDAMYEDAFDYYDKTASEADKNRYRSSSSGGTSTGNTTSSTAQPAHHTISNSSSSPSGGSTGGSNSNSTQPSTQTTQSSNQSAAQQAQSILNNYPIPNANASSNSTQSTTQAAPQAAPAQTTQPATQAAPQAAPAQTTQQATQAAPQAAPAQTTQQATQAATQAAPAQTTQQATQAAPQAAPAQTTQQATQSAPQAAPAQTTQQAAPQAAPAQTTQTAPVSSPVQQTSVQQTPITNNVGNVSAQNVQANNIFSTAQRNIEASRNIHTPSVTIQNGNASHNDNTLLNQLQSANAQNEAEIKKLNLLNRLLEVNNEIQRLETLKSRTSDGNIFDDCVNKIKALEREKTSIKEELNRM